MNKNKNHKENLKYFVLNNENNNKMCGMQVKHGLKGNLQFSLLILEKNSLKINHLRFQLKKIKTKCKPNSKYKERKK